MKSLQEYELDDSLTLYTREHTSSWEPKLTDYGALKGGDWNFFSIEDAKNLHIAETSCLTIDVRLIKDSGSSKTQRILNEYTCGDVVHGFLELRNITSQPIRFDALCLSLRGHIVVVDSQSKSRNIRTILKMDDYDEGLNSKVTSHVELPGDRILRPNSRYMKEFAFKIPDQLLETECPYGIMQHYNMPPSLGLDRCHKQFKYQNLEIDKILGYARAKEIGSPIWAWDQAEDLSVSYSIEAIIVGKDERRNERCILKQFEHFIRIVPPSIPSSTEATHPGLQSVGSQFFYRKAYCSSFLRRLFKFVGFPSKDHLDESGIILLGAPVPLNPCRYRSPQLIANQNAFILKNPHERHNRLRIQGIVPLEKRSPMRELSISLGYLPVSNKTHAPPKIRFMEVELLSITGRSSHHIPTNLDHSILLDQREMDRLKKESAEYSDVDIDVTRLPDAFDSRRTRKRNSRSRWFFNGSEYIQELLIDVEPPKNFSKTLVPSFTSCTCFRSYYIRINIIFKNTVSRTHLDVPIVISNTIFDYI